MSIALLGVVAMQYYFIRETYKQNSILFDEAVNASLAKVAGEIEKTEVLEYAKIQSKANQVKYEVEQEKQKRLAKQLDIQQQIEKLRLQQYMAYQKFKDAEESLKSTFPNAAPIYNWFYETYYRKKSNRDLIEITVEFEQLPGSTMVDNYTNVSAKKEVPRIEAKDDSMRYVIPHIELGSRNINSYQIATLPPRGDEGIALKIMELNAELKKLNFEFLADAKNVFDTLAAIGGKKAGVVEDVAASMEMANRPLEQRLNQALLERLLISELASRDIHSPFRMEIRDKYRLLYPLSHVEDTHAHEKLTPYSTALFKGDIGESTGKLTIYFLNKRAVIVDNMSYLILPTLALFALLIGCFAYTLSIVFRQKKISEMKTDFINNMTHEFKTPVATIMIASESLRDPEIATNEARVNKLANIIYDENVRLGSHIERVLNIAKLEKENIKIERTEVEINPLLENVLDSMQLQLQKAEGTLTTELLAENDTVIGDELHLSNVFFNLVDNAIKYSTAPPNITVKSRANKSNIIISVSDKGMGMTREQQEKIFDQFYRIPTGNVHNVKGFGLGLSYVHDIIKRLDGKIQVKSEKDKGTTFEVTLPLKSGKY